MIGNRLNPFSLGSYLGVNWDRRLRAAAHEKGLQLMYLYNVVPSRDTILQCPQCNVPMRTITDRNRGIGWRFSCPNNHRMEPTQNTFFERVRLNEVGSDAVIKAAYCWFTDVPVTQAMGYVNIASDTCVAWYSYFRSVATKIAWHDFLPIGGDTDIVEVDETHLFRRKFQVGRLGMWRDVWLFGGISRTTKIRFGVIVPDRSSDTLLPIMQQYIDSDTFICSDEWRAYTTCGQAFSGHGTVNHSRSFINPPRNQDPLWVPLGRFHEACLDKQWMGPFPAPNVVPVRYHTQNGERSWENLKKTLRTCNSLELAEGYVGEWMYRSNILNRIPESGPRFGRFLDDMRRAYPGIGKQKMSETLDDCTCHECDPPVTFPSTDCFTS